MMREFARTFPGEATARRCFFRAPPCRPLLWPEAILLLNLLLLRQLVVIALFAFTVVGTPPAPAVAAAVALVVVVLLASHDPNMGGRVLKEWLSRSGADCRGSSCTSDRATRESAIVLPVMIYVQSAG